MRVDNLVLLNALLFVLENGCKWRALPHEFGRWHTVYMRLSRWSKAGVIERVFARLQQEQILVIRSRPSAWTAPASRSTPTARARAKNGPQAIGRSRGGWTTKVHLVAASDRCALKLSLTPGQWGDGPAGRELLRAYGPAPTPGCALLMDCAYQGNATRALARELGYVPVVPPNPQRRDPWEYDRVLYRRRNEVERLFRRLKGFRRVFARFDKLDVMFTAFVHLALLFDALR